MSLLSDFLLVLLQTEHTAPTVYMSGYPLIFGILAAMAHVLSGPDHLAAVGPLAVNVRIKSWLIGMSWGIGHLIGMLLIGVLFFYFRELIPVDFISANSEKIVGGLLILIGLWSFGRMFRYYKAGKHKHAHTHQTGDGAIFIHEHKHEHDDHTVHLHVHKKHEKQTYWAALGIGVIHGLAGVSHFISLLPTLAFPSKTDSALYLFGFGIGTITAMVLFSVTLGFIATKASQHKQDIIMKSIMGITGAAAILVGIYWIYSTV